ncbi:hypothetical protein PENSPDRAFT_363030 [Peniophora sp. CONT]|nr:hypothetical protein PENSPDRAFT_363030 [Peniophora sp. CONT]
MSDRGRSSRRARSASPEPGKHQALADAPSSSTLPTPSTYSRAQSASARTSSFGLKPAGHETIQPGREHMNRARPYFNTLPPMKFIKGFFGEVDSPRIIPDLDLSRIAVPRFGNNLVVGERRRQFARALCAVINESNLCPELNFVVISRLGSELHIQAYNVEDGTPATDVALPIYIRDDQYYDPVWDSSLRTDTDYDDIRQDLLTEYLHQFQIAPRTHIFSLEITGSCARLVRTDHAGMVGSVSFNWKEDSYYLSEFLWRMGQLSNDGLGLDTTWSAATPEEIAVTLAAVQADDPDGDYSGALVKKLLLLNDSINPDVQDGAYDVFAVLAHNFAPRPELVGRYTMGFRAYCPVTREVIWVKDSWTRSDTFFEPEGVTMRKLHAEGVPHIARVHSAGYVRANDDRVQITLSGRPRFKSESASGVVYTHYRIAYRDIGRPLSMFRSTRELVSAVCDAVQAHTSAYEVGVIHRDISQGNILIDKDGRGMLIDWEMALDRDLLSTEQYDRACQHHCGKFAATLSL